MTFLRTILVVLSSLVLNKEIYEETWRRTTLIFICKKAEGDQSKSRYKGKRIRKSILIRPSRMLIDQRGGARPGSWRGQRPSVFLCGISIIMYRIIRSVQSTVGTPLLRVTRLCMIRIYFWRRSSASPPLDPLHFQKKDFRVFALRLLW